MTLELAASKVLLIVVSMSALASCSRTNVVDGGEDRQFGDILSYVDAYDGRQVTVSGWITLRPEDQNLWASWRAHERWDTKKCISLTNYDILSKKAPLLDGRFVRITGVIRKDASHGGTILRLPACQDVALEVTHVSEVARAIPVK